jgi:hypothetical protein
VEIEEATPEPELYPALTRAREKFMHELNLIEREMVKLEADEERLLSSLDLGNFLLDHVMRREIEIWTGKVKKVVWKWRIENMEDPLLDTVG